jgi:hypothetical protein
MAAQRIDGAVHMIDETKGDKFMRLLSIVGTAALVTVLGVAAPVCAQEESHPQEEKRAEDRPGQDQEKDKQVRPEDKRTQKDDNRAEQQDKKAEQQDKHAEQADKKAERDDKSAMREDRHEAARIPDERFRANFGREHRFHIGRPVIVEGAPRFRYGGYWFVIAQPWPAGWGYDDEVYVDYVDGGYYVLSPVHPGLRIAINVVF